jgi:hypothetical protein
MTDTRDRMLFTITRCLTLLNLPFVRTCGYEQSFRQQPNSPLIKLMKQFHIEQIEAASSDSYELNCHPFRKKKYLAWPICDPDIFLSEKLVYLSSPG